MLEVFDSRKNTNCTWLEGFDSYRSCIVPEAFPDLSKLSMAKLAYKFQTGSFDLPLVPCGMRKVSCNRFVHLQKQRRNMVNRCVVWEPTLSTIYYCSKIVVTSNKQRSSWQLFLVTKYTIKSFLTDMQRMQLACHFQGFCLPPAGYHWCEQGREKREI